jgi:hypothetical protein
MNGTQQFLIVCVMIAGGVFALFGLRDGAATKERLEPVLKLTIEELTLREIQDYMRRTVPDPDAEIVWRGPLIQHDAGYWQDVKVRAKNAFGGPVFANWVMRYTLEGKLIKCRTLDDFVVHAMDTYSKEDRDVLFKAMDDAKPQ